MKSDIRKYLLDIAFAIEAIENYLGRDTRDFNVFSSNQMVQDAVERRLSIIGEALKSITKNRARYRNFICKTNC